MSDDSDDEPIAFKRQKLEHANGNGKPASRQTKERVSYKEDSSEEEELEKPKPKAAAKPKAKKTPPSAKSKLDASKQRQSNGVKKEPKESKDSKPVAVKREKKVFDNPGQTRDTPDETDPLRKFYTSLLEQRPESLMAKKWLCMYGLLSVDEAEAYLAEVGKGIKSPDRKVAVSRTPKKGPGGRPSKALAAKPTPKRKQKKDSSDEDEESEEEIVIKKKPPIKTAAVKRLSSASGAKATTKDVAFDDGGLDGSSSDDDVPLAKRKA